MKSIIIRIIIAAIFIAVAIISFTACNPLKKAQGIAKAQPEKFVEIIRDKFPCVPDAFPDTSHRSDSTKYLAALKAMEEYINESSGIYDSLLAVKSKGDCDTGWYKDIIKLQSEIIESLNKKAKQLPPIHDTIPKIVQVKDLAEVQAKQNIINSKEAQIEALTVVNKNFVSVNAGLRKFRNITIWILIILVAGTILGFVLKKYLIVGKTVKTVAKLVKDST